MATPVGTMICDPGPCDPSALMGVVRDISLLPLLVFAAAAFVAGLKLSRAGLLLPALCMAAIGGAFYVGFDRKLLIIRQAIIGTGGYPVTDQLWLRAWRETLHDYAIGFLAFAIVPFIVGLVAAAIQRRKRKLAHA